MNGLRVSVTLVLAALLGGCHKPVMPSLTSPGASACGDPCAAMVCPGGSACTWNTSCQPRCEVQPLSPNGH